MRNKIIFGAVFVIVVIIAVITFLGINNKQPGNQDKAAVFNCTDGKSITAVFHLPDDKNVDLVLSDGRKLSIPRAISGSGARYANADESFVFWNKGNTAFITENGKTTYQDCATNDSESNSAQNYSTAKYISDKYGFEISFPSNIVPEYQFKQYYHLSNNWRAEASSESKGDVLFSIPVFRVDNGGVATGKPYPLYFDAEVRIGASSDPAEVANCYKPDPGYENQQITDVQINGVDFKKFDFGGAGMMQYLQGVSYRIVRDNACLTIEQIKTGSSYRDDSMLPGIPDEQLNGYYIEAGNIIQSLKFN
ncbi:MAG: MliC family protein [Candidatus Paceibacterota bacterium]